MLKTPQRHQAHYIPNRWLLRPLNPQLGARPATAIAAPPRPDQPQAFLGRLGRLIHRVERVTRGNNPTPLTRVLPCHPPAQAATAKEISLRELPGVFCSNTPAQEAQFGGELWRTSDAHCPVSDEWQRCWWHVSRPAINRPVAFWLTPEEFSPPGRVFQGPGVRSTPQLAAPAGSFALASGATTWKPSFGPS